MTKCKVNDLNHIIKTIEIILKEIDKETNDIFYSTIETIINIYTLKILKTIILKNQLD